MTRTWSHQETWPGHAASVAESRDFVAGHLRDHQLPSLVDGARVVVSELATNAVRHAATAYTVTLHCADEGVTIDVRDGSPLVPAARTSGDPYEAFGRGLTIVDGYSDDWGVRKDAGGGKSVWARLAVADETGGNGSGLRVDPAANVPTTGDRGARPPGFTAG
jgi:anti-sigma regulatory factor (Ser/Thr protein kinase)